MRIKNPYYVDMILANLIQGGVERLQVVSDFDRTISLCHFDGKPCPTSNAVLEMSRFVSHEIRKQVVCSNFMFYAITFAILLLCLACKFEELRDKYLPIEHDPHMSREDKTPFMIEWWTKSLQLTVQTGITRENINEIVKNSNTHLKEGCQWFFYTLERHDIPLLIFSAGLGNIIQEWINHECGLFKNMKIISNFMKFNNETNAIVGFEGSIIHIFNKNEGVLIDTEYEKLIRDRANVILLGDSLGDVEMAAGFPTLNNLLKIGFLNNHVDENLDKYMDAYDIVIIQDSTFNVPNAILRSII